MRRLLLALLLLLLLPSATCARGQTVLQVKMVVRGGVVYVDVYGASYIDDPSTLDDIFYPVWSALNSPRPRLPPPSPPHVWDAIMVTMTGYLQSTTRSPFIHVSGLEHYMLTWDLYLYYDGVPVERVGRACYTTLEMNVSNADYYFVAFRAYNLAWKALHVTAPLELEQFGIGVDLVPLSRATLINASVLPPLEKWNWYFNGTHTIARYWLYREICTETVGGRQACYAGIRAEIVFEGYAIPVGEDLVMVPTNIGIAIAGIATLYLAIVAIHALSNTLKRIIQKTRYIQKKNTKTSQVGGFVAR